MIRWAGARHRPALGLHVCALLCVACGGTRSTDRIFDGRTLTGRYIEPEAYAAYTEGAYHEARGEWAAAERAYREALASDPSSPPIWTRLGVLACRGDLREALSCFDEAVSEEEHAPAWIERARCLARHARAEPALAAAKRGVQLDPTDADANLLVAKLYQDRGEPEQASAWLFAWLLLQPDVAGRERQLLARSRSLGDPELSTLVRDELRHLRPLGTGPAGRSQVHQTPHAAANLPSDAVLQAVRKGELDSARLAAAEAGLSHRDLALLALRSAQPALALAQAELLLGADPLNSEGYVLGLFAATLLGDETRFRALLDEHERRPLSQQSIAELLTDLLRMRVGNDAAEHWRAAWLRALEPARRPAPAPRR